MSDKELLELAAKAVGWKVVRWTDDDTAMLLEGIQTPFNALYENPHSDCMGDALRLAVECALFESFDFCQTMSAAQSQSNPNEATRRAIVIAAAEIGRNMK